MLFSSWFSRLNINSVGLRIYIEFMLKNLYQIYVLK